MTARLSMGHFAMHCLHTPFYTFKAANDPFIKEEE